ncbi:MULTISPECIES: hypothetical protein [Aneurinibacillus]|uniref:Uncharacterized protein n=1 Tax=Aneurinibacillus thermoaerophilus TaxID=143495 RepID=A0A1G8AKP4_ANETH|nr:MULTISPECIES: hypothetical protein [Aneurinibacillus]AMA71491.1 hypothetical protein ACH33_00595 [Aneurinibacillus sp. XH2]MED0675330.1 hypothetical protein [Aneurinibacillus thermoaerophilus]MED0678623.1 hypothetical protein [Aneurinibacillus thermoaerophilus]MED0738288.1 hypothetical protein [Aneurinibacillus thermoaerophilus]MED0756577.1 hypothetical protein [Aneurinibacillus thermoaerophilus]
MWQALSISHNIFGFQLEQNWDEAWTAVALVKEMHDKLEIRVDIHIFYVKSREEYEQLLEAIRYFANMKKREAGKKNCVIYFQCKGILTEAIELPLPVTRYKNGRMFVDVEFSEELGNI